MIDSARLKYILNNQLIGMSRSLGQLMYGRDLQLLDGDELLFVVVFSDCFIERYVMDFTPFPIQLDRPMDGTYGFLCEYDRSHSKETVQELHEAIFRNYHEFTLSSGRPSNVKGLNLFVMTFASLIHLGAESSAKLHNRPAPPLYLEPYLDFCAEKAVRLGEALTESKSERQQVPAQPRPASSRQAPERQPQGEAFIPPRKQSSAGKYILLAVLAVVILWLISR